jgi:hypothetical protein
MKVQTNAGAPIFDGSNGGVALDVSLYKPDSRPDGIPWLRITQSNAILECASMGTGYHLVTAKEWAALARNIESVDSNWSSGIAGTGALYSGHSDGASSPTAVADSFGVAGTNVLAASDDTNPYAGTGNAQGDAFGAGKEQRRTFELSNGGVIWDVAGNARDYNDVDGLGGTISHLNGGAAAYYDALSSGISDLVATITLSSGGTFDLSWLTPATPGLTHAANNIGQIYAEGGSKTGYSGRFLTRGGNFSAGNSPGLFAGDLDSDNATAAGSAGFRCVKNL